jgi:lipoprotein signal peptidase
MDFPVFNVADILVCVGAGLFLVYELFFDTDVKKEKKNG